MTAYSHFPIHISNKSVCQNLYVTAPFDSDGSADSFCVFIILLRSIDDCFNASQSTARDPSRSFLENEKSMSIHGWMRLLTLINVASSEFCLDTGKVDLGGCK